MYTQMPPEAIIEIADSAVRKDVKVVCPFIFTSTEAMFFTPEDDGTLRIPELFYNSINGHRFDPDLASGEMMRRLFGYHSVAHRSVDGVEPLGLIKVKSGNESKVIAPLVVDLSVDIQRLQEPSDFWKERVRYRRQFLWLPFHDIDDTCIRNKNGSVIELAQFYIAQATEIIES